MARVEVVALLGVITLLGIVVELVRRRLLSEGYSLLWLLTTIVLLILSIFRELLDVLASLVGIFYPPTALFVVGFGFVLLILLQFSVAVSRLSDQNKKLAQEIGLLKWRLGQLAGEHHNRPLESSEDKPDKESQHA